MRSLKDASAHAGCMTTACTTPRRGLTNAVRAVAGSWESAVWGVSSDLGAASRSNNATDVVCTQGRRRAQQLARRRVVALDRAGIAGHLSTANPSARQATLVRLRVRARIHRRSRRTSRPPSLVNAAPFHPATAASGSGTVMRGSVARGRPLEVWPAVLRHCTTYASSVATTTVSAAPAASVMDSIRRH